MHINVQVNSLTPSGAAAQRNADSADVCHIFFVTRRPRFDLSVVCKNNNGVEVGGSCVLHNGLSTPSLVYSISLELPAAALTSVSAEEIEPSGSCSKPDVLF